MKNFVKERLAVYKHADNEKEVVRIKEIEESIEDPTESILSTKRLTISCVDGTTKNISASEAFPVSLKELYLFVKQGEKLLLQKQ
jgi:hypothetical protein